MNVPNILLGFNRIIGVTFGGLVIDSNENFNKEIQFGK